MESKCIIKAGTEPRVCSDGEEEEEEGRKEGRKEGDVLRHPFVLNRSSRKCSEQEIASYYVHT